MSKNTLIIIAITALIVAIAAVSVAVIALKPGEKTQKNIEGSLEEIMAKLYEGIPEDKMPMMLMNMEVTSDTAEYHIGTSDIEYKEALVSESGVGSIAHSVVLIRLNDARDAEEAVAKIKEHANPRKWICVEADNVIVKSKGDLVVLIMSNGELELAPTLDANFEGLK